MESRKQEVSGVDGQVKWGSVSAMDFVHVLIYLLTQMHSFAKRLSCSAYIYTPSPSALKYQETQWRSIEYSNCSSEESCQSAPSCLWPTSRIALPVGQFELNKFLLLLLLLFVDWLLLLSLFLPSLLKCLMLEVFPTEVGVYFVKSYSTYHL